MSQPQLPFDEQGEARDALNSAVASYGPRILQNPQVLRNVVTDLLPDLSREQSLLIAAAEAGVASELSQHVQDQNLDATTAVQLAAHALSGKKSIDADASMWVTTEYAKAMGYPVPAYVPSVPASTAPLESGPADPPPPSPVSPLGPSVPPGQPIVSPGGSGPSVPQQSAPPGQPVPPPSVPPGQSGPPGWTAPPQSVPPWASDPAAQSPPGYGPPPLPPGTGWTNGMPTPSWAPGPPPRGNGKKRGILFGAAGAAGVLVLYLVLAAAAHIAPFAKATPKPSPPPQHHVVSTPSPLPSTPSPSPTEDNQQVASAIADVAVGNGPLSALSGPDGTADKATCDPRTVSNPPDPSTPTTASCDIIYSDGTEWQQTVTIYFDMNGNAVRDSTDSGTQIG